MIAITNINTAQAQDFARLVELQQLHSETTLLLEKLEARMSTDSLKAAVASSTEYVVLQESLATATKDITALFEAHPEWREVGKKSVKTPYGSVEQRSATELEVPNEAATVALIKVMCDQKCLDPKNYLRVEEKPNLEALEALGNDELNKLGVTRVTHEKITVKPAKITASKVVKAAKSLQTAKSEVAA